MSILASTVAGIRLAGTRVALPLLTGFVCLTAVAQSTTAIISGAVSDASGAAVAGAKVSVKNVGTGITQMTATVGQGRYHIPELIVGDYEVQVTQTGFQAVLRTGLTLTVGNEAVVDISLPVGQSQQTVTVEARASQVATTFKA
jgi:hypothetical protein